MSEEYLEAFTKEMPDVSLIAIDSPQFSLVPKQWRPVVDFVDAQERIDYALSLWPRDFLDYLPRFKKLTQTKLLDVQIIERKEDVLCLLYIFYQKTRSPRFWFGENPAGFGDKKPPFFDCIPIEMQNFLHTVHAGYLFERTWIGLYQPALMETFAQIVGQPEGDPLEIDGWGDDDMLDAHKLLAVAESPGNVKYCVSPEIPKGKILTIDDSAQEPPGDFWEVLDDIISFGIELG